MYNKWGKCRKASDGSISYHPLVYHLLDVAAVGYEYLAHDKRLLRLIADRLGLSENEARNLICYFLALHDLGKFSIGFSDKRCRFHHTSLGLFMWELIQERRAKNCYDSDAEYAVWTWRDTVLPFVKATTGHHGKPVNVILRPHSRVCYTEEDLELANSFMEDVYVLFDTPSFAFPSNIIMDNTGNIQQTFQLLSWLLAGFIILADWVGSDDDYFKYVPEELSLSEYWKKYARKRALKALAHSGLLPNEVSQNAGFAALFPEYKDTPTPLQQYVSACKVRNTQQLVIIEDETGSGKTEAAVTYSHRCLIESLATGIFFALPTMATSNPMYERLVDVYKRIFAEDTQPSLILAHSSNYLIEKFHSSIYNKAPAREEDPETIAAQCNAWLADNRKKALLGDVGVGTVDQVLLSILPGNHQAMRMFGLFRSILVVDEVHAYDAYMNELLCRVLKCHAAAGGSAVLLSATLPIELRQRFADSFSEGIGCDHRKLESIAYPLVTHIDKFEAREVKINASKPQHKVNIEFIDNLAVVKEKVVTAARKGVCVAWIRNTEKDAADAFREIRELVGDENIDLFHAGFVMGDRLEIENKVLKCFGKGSSPQDRRGKIVIATQVIEQSLNLDFDYIVSDLTLIDLLIQRIGRLWRYGTLLNPERAGKTPLFTVFAPELTDDPQPYWYSNFSPMVARYIYRNHGKLWLTAHILAERKSITFPDDLRFLIEYVYGKDADSRIPTSLKAQEQHAKELADKEIREATANALNISKGYDYPVDGVYRWNKVIPTRLGEDYKLCRLAKWDGEHLTSLHAEGWEMSQVSIPERKVKDIKVNSAKLRAVIENTKEEMRDKGKWSEIIPLISEDDTTWTSSNDIAITNAYKQSVYLQYDKKFGLIVDR